MFTLKAPAKINWLLSVLRKREDGYHEISSLMQCVTLYDYLTFVHSDKIELITDAGIPTAENLVYKTATLLKQELSVNRGASITLKKEIPLSAGLGGGSSDAACTLIGLNRLWELGLNDEELIKYGGILGSDIPFFIKEPFAEVQGRGEIVRQLKAKTSYFILLVKPDLSVSTKWAYKEVSGLLTPVEITGPPELTNRTNNIKLLCQALDAKDYRSIASMLKNDLEIPVVRKFPVVEELKNRLLAAGAQASLMSGSGPTVFGVFENRGTAEIATKDMKPNWCRVVETITTVDSDSEQ
ncbi:MAG: 4-(cytidine 5'-diphospho)-2-C-methyl-D-erythritol kinase [Nitrospirae bacterium]|nr:4-(cytidine 5'-diphospho)-2-C-methyl-D-erythritol kinase [Nitrospirota bacterium]